MSKKTLTVELPEDIYERFIETVTAEGGPWRSRRKEETFTGAVESAVYAALLLFLQGLTDDSDLPKFREYARVKYPQLDEDMITKIADLIEREKERLPPTERIMKTTIHVQSGQLNKEDVRALLQAIRLCEMATFPDKEIRILVEVPELTADETKGILTSIKPPFKYGPAVLKVQKEG